MCSSVFLFNNCFLEGRLCCLWTNIVKKERMYGTCCKSAYSYSSFFTEGKYCPREIRNESVSTQHANLVAVQNYVRVLA